MREFSNFPLSLSAVLVTSFVSLQVADMRSSVYLELTLPQMLNLKLHQKRFTSYRERMTAASSANLLSDEFLNVHDLPGQGLVFYDVDTVRKVFQEVYANKTFAVHPRLYEHLKLLTQQVITEPQSATKN